MAAAVNNNKGFSLVELMVALVILLVSLLGLLAVLTTSISANIDNELRNTAVRLVNQTAESIHGLPIDDSDISDTTTGTSHIRDASSSTQDLKGFPKPTQSIRGFQQSYSISWNVIDKDVKDNGANLKEIIISITYTNPQRESHSHKAVIYKHRRL